MAKPSNSAESRKSRTAQATGKHPDRFINRELSWIEFNQRVLEKAMDEAVPLLERTKFLAITASNLDEFLMVRVGGLQMLAGEGNYRVGPAGMTPAERLRAVEKRLRRMTADQYACYTRQLEPSLAGAGIRRVRSDDLTPDLRRHLERVFEDEVLPVLSPAAVRVEENPPLLMNRILHIGVRLAPAPDDAEGCRLAVIPIGRFLDRFVRLPGPGDFAFMLLEDLVTLFIARVFPGETVEEAVPFRIVRNADLELREDLAHDLMIEMRAVLDARKRSACVQLQMDARAGQPFLALFQKLLGVGPSEVFLVPGPLDLSALMALQKIEGRSELRDEPWAPQPSPEIEPGSNVFEVLRDRDVLLYHPYDSFEPCIRMLTQAADDPDVIAVKQILYRTSDNSPVVAALMRAAQRGKYVTAVVEIKARFDEARNMEWANALEDAGVQVIYGVKGLKTHAKLCLVVRREPSGLRRYMHFGTGNYNEETARLYSDVSYLTADEALGRDASAFLNSITGYSQPQRFLKLTAAPISLRAKLLELIRGEAERCRQGQPCAISGKLNSLVDPRIIEALLAASDAGVRIRLNVRGICCLCPGGRGRARNIRITSIVDRFLEHARIFYFYHGGDERLFISSADWMPRNLDRRVELLVPVEDPACRAKLLRILETHLRDTASAWRLRSDGRYGRIAPSSRSGRIRSQEQIYSQACRRAKEALQAKRTLFEPHRPPSP